MSHNIESIELYLNECYGCDKSNKYGELRRYILAKQIPMSNFKVNRIVLSRNWQDLQKSLGIEAPFIKIIDENGEAYMTYDELLKKIHTEMQPAIIEAPKAKKVVKKTANIKKKETKTVKID